MWQWIHFYIYVALSPVSPHLYLPASITLNDLLDAYDIDRNLQAILDILDYTYYLGELERTRYIHVPFGRSLDKTVVLIEDCSGGSYRDEIDLFATTINDWCRYNGEPISVSNTIVQLRKALLTHILRDNVHPLVDDYVCRYYMVIIGSFIHASR